MFKFIHAADLHIDSPLRGLEQYEGAPVGEIRGATRRALENLVDLALEERVAFVVLSGDLYDGDWKDFNTGLFFARQMARLKDGDIPVYLVSGNHDAASQITRHLTMPDNVKRFKDSRPETIQLEHLGVAIHGQSYATQAVTDNLAATYPKPVGGVFNIGLLHTSVDGREGHASYAPTSINELKAREYEYWALGHVHKQEILSMNPWVVFPGNTQGRHVKETGSKGCMLVTVADNLRVTSVIPKPLDVVRWVDSTVGVLVPLTTIEDACEQMSKVFADHASRRDGRLLAIRLRLNLTAKGFASLTGDLERWENESRRVATEVANGAIWLSRIDPVPPATEELLALSGSPLLEDLLKELSSAGPEALLDSDVRDDLRAFAAFVPAVLKDGDASIDSADPTVLDKAFQDARRMLLSHLLSGSERK